MGSLAAVAAMLSAVAGISRSRMERVPGAVERGGREVQSVHLQALAAL
jgi:hypothetical protein